MKHIRNFISKITLFTLSFALLLPLSVRAEYIETPNGVSVAQYEPDSVIVQFKEGESPAELQQKAAIEKTEPTSLIDRIKSALIPSLNGTQTAEQQLNTLASVDAQAGVLVKEQLNDSASVDQRTFVYTLDQTKSVEQVVAQYKAQPEVELVEPNYIYHSLGAPNDSYYSQMWGLSKIKAAAAWDITTGSKSVLVADIDTGIDDTHPDLKNNIVEIKNYVACSGDQLKHGTHTAGTIGAVGNNSAGVVGVNWNVGLLVLKVAECQGGGMSLSNIASAINYAVSKHAKVINMSLGGASSSQLMASAIKNAVDRGTVVVVAAGNCGTRPSQSGCGSPPRTISSDSLYPSSDPNVIDVGATASNDSLAVFSSTGSSVDVSAPGDQILSTVPGGYSKFSGTSMAAPHVTGLVALMFAADPSLTPARVKQILESTSVDLGPAGRDIQFGSGRIDAEAALKAVSNGGPLPTAQPTAIPIPTSRPIPTTRPTSIPIPTLRPTAIPTSKPIPTIGNSNEADFDRNGRVDLADFNQWRLAYLSGNSTLKYFNIWRIAYLKNTF